MNSVTFGLSRRHMLTAVALTGLSAKLPSARAGCSRMADLVTPELETAEPAPGRRVRITPPEYHGTEIHHSLFLPSNWSKGGPKWPVIVEYTGNYFPACGSSGEVGGANLGFGLSGGRDFLWIVMPCVDPAAGRNAIRWWGDRRATVDYCKVNLPRLLEQYAGDPDRVLLCGFSRGAIACSYIGLADDGIASHWRAFMTHDHFDGERKWNYPDSDREAALGRLARLNGRPVLVSGQDTRALQRDYLAGHAELGRFTFQNVPVAELFHIPDGPVIHPHTDLWMHRDSRYRRETRSWVRKALD